MTIAAERSCRTRTERLTVFSDEVVTDNLSESWKLTPDLRLLKSEWD